MHFDRQELQSKYEQVVLLDIDLANKHNIEQMLWKSAFYQIIEFLRKNTLEEVAGEMYRQHLIALLEEVIATANLLRELYRGSSVSLTICTTDIYAIVLPSA